MIALFAFHSIAAVACFWMKRTGRYDLAWLAAMVSALLIAPILLAVLRGHRLKMGFDELDYVLGFAGWTNCFGAALAVLTIPPAAVESFETAVRALSVH